MLEGLDDIALSLKKLGIIEKFEKNLKNENKDNNDYVIKTSCL